MEAEADWDHLRTPETYLGYGRGDQFASPDGATFDERRAYELPEHLHLNHWALAGEWTIGRESVVLDQAGGTIAYRLRARDAHLVLSSGAREPIPFRVLLDGQAPGPSHGVDVDLDGNGVLADGRLYQLVREHDAVRDRTLEITFLEPGAEAYVFTFGSRCRGRSRIMVALWAARRTRGNPWAETSRRFLPLFATGSGNARRCRRVVLAACTRGWVRAPEGG